MTDPRPEVLPPATANTGALPVLGLDLQEGKVVPRKQVFSWALWDWATQPFNTVILTFIWTYNDFFPQLIYLTSPDYLTVPVGLRTLVDSSGGSYGQLMAMSVLSLVPTFAVFLVFQRRLVEGIATTGLKG